MNRKLIVFLVKDTIIWVFSFCVLIIIILSDFWYGLGVADSINNIVGHTLNNLIPVENHHLSYTSYHPVSASYILKFVFLL